MTPSPKNTRVAIYSRVSTVNKGQNPENQLTQLREFCATQGWIVCEEFVDKASGKNANRPEFQRMFDSAKHHKFDLLLFWSLDRLSREGVFETLGHLQTLTGLGIGWRSFTEQYLDSTGIFKDAVISILAVVAKQEHTRIVERTSAGLDTIRANGMYSTKKQRVVRFGNPRWKESIAKAQAARRAKFAEAHAGDY